MLSPGSSQDSPSWLWGTVCTGTPQHVESEGWKDAPVTLKDIPSTSNPHPNLETPVFLLTALRVSSLALQQDAQESGPQDTHSVLPSQGTVLGHPKRGAAHSCPVSPCTRCSASRAGSQMRHALSLSHTQAALLCAAWLPTSRMPSEPCFVIYPHFMFSCAQLVPLPAFLPRTVLFTF